MCAQASHNDIPTRQAIKYGAVLIEDQTIPCCIADDDMVYIPTPGVCGALNIPPEPELERIMASTALAHGLVRVPFEVPREESEAPAMELFPAISLTRLHAWLMMIPDSLVPDVETRARLAAMQERLADLIYSYLGRRLIPEELAETLERPLSPETRALIKAMEQVPGLEEDMKVTKGQVQNVSDRLKVLEVALSLSAPTGSFIDKRQREVYRQIIGIVGQAYEKKHPGQFDNIEARLKEQFDFVFYKVIKSEQWEAVIRSLLATYKSLVPPGTITPKIFEDALKLRTTPPIEKQQPGLF